MLFKEKWSYGLLIGGVIGLFLWCFDYDFFVNVSGPSTQISDTITNLFGVNHTIFGFFLSPIILIILFGLIGGLMGYALKFFRSKQKKKK
jgi:hypothetical protein